MAAPPKLHIVGGLHPWLPFEYYTTMLQAIREEAPHLHIKAFTAVEIVHFARISGRGRRGLEGLRDVLRDLQEAGLGSLPGGGAEVFDDRVHDEAFKGKIRAGQWLDVHRAAHELGINSNATILYGHVERWQERDSPPASAPRAAGPDASGLGREITACRVRRGKTTKAKTQRPSSSPDRTNSIQAPVCPSRSSALRGTSRRSSLCRSIPIAARWNTCPAPPAWRTCARWPSLA